jgi:hypothetical protein
LVGASLRTKMIFDDDGMMMMTMDNAVATSFS